MRRNELFLLVFGGIIASVLLLALKQVPTGQALNPEEATDQLFLPALWAPDIPPTPIPTETPSPTATATPEPLSPLKNSSFEDGWENRNAGVGGLINQHPNDWTLFWIQPGDPLFDDSSTLAAGVPEARHLSPENLPPKEWLGAPEALILDGTWTYKMFHFSAPFGASISQTVSGLAPDSEWRVTVPVQVHLHPVTGDLFDEHTAETSLWVDGIGGWATAKDMGDRKWCKHERVFTVNEDGAVEIVLRVKSKWARPKDFFVDGIRLQPADQASPYPDMDPCKQNLTLIKYRPAVEPDSR